MDLSTTGERITIPLGIQAFIYTSSGYLELETDTAMILKCLNDLWSRPGPVFTTGSADPLSCLPAEELNQ